MTIVLTPHNDDETLFAAYVCMREQARIICCFYPVLQSRSGVTGPTRVAESKCAAEALGCSFMQLEATSDLNPEEDVLSSSLLYAVRSLPGSGEGERVWAPAFEEGGHEQHNMLATVAERLFGSRVRRYLTYRRGEGRSTSPWQSDPSADEVARKRRAMDCYQSQIALPNVAFWFSDESGWQDEWILL